MKTLLTFSLAAAALALTSAPAFAVVIPRFPLIAPAVAS